MARRRCLRGVPRYPAASLSRGAGAAAAILLGTLLSGCAEEVPPCGCDAFCATLDRCGLRAAAVCLDHCEDDEYSDESFRNCICRAQGDDCDSGVLACYEQEGDD